MVLGFYNILSNQETYRDSRERHHIIGNDLLTPRMMNVAEGLLFWFLVFLIRLSGVLNAMNGDNSEFSANFQCSVLGRYRAAQVVK